jgi:hypothetical protein
MRRSEFAIGFGVSSIACRLDAAHMLGLSPDEGLQLAQYRRADFVMIGATFVTKGLSSRPSGAGTCRQIRVAA